MKTKYAPNQRLLFSPVGSCIRTDFEVFAVRNGWVWVTVYDPTLHLTYDVLRWELSAP